MVNLRLIYLLGLQDCWLVQRRKYIPFVGNELENVGFLLR